MVGPDYDGITDMSQLPEEAFTPQRFQQGDTVEGEVVRVDEEGIVVSVGLKTEGMVPAAEMRTITQEERENLTPGQRMAFTVLRRERGSEMALLSLDQARKAQLWIDLQQNLAEGDPVTVKVTGFNRGGLEVDLRGVRGFVPMSHMAPTSADGREKDLSSPGRRGGHVQRAGNGPSPGAVGAVRAGALPAAARRGQAPVH